MDCFRNGTPTSSTFCFAELSKSLARLEAHLPGYLYGSEFHNVCPQHQFSATYTSMQLWSSRSKGTYPYADDNTICIQTRSNESRREFIHKTSSVVNSVERTYRKIKRVLAKAKNALIPFFQQFEGTAISGVQMTHCHRILGILLDSNRRFHKNSVEVLMKCRRALTWIQTYRRIFSFQQRKQVYVSFVQSLMD